MIKIKMIRGNNPMPRLGEINISINENEALLGKMPELSSYAILISPPNEKGVCEKGYISPSLYHRILEEVLE